MQTLSFTAMNTSVLLAAEAPGRADGALAKARRLVDELEQKFSRFLPDSELSSMNRSAGEWRAVSAELFEVVALAIDLARETEGLFDPTILPALMHAGYDRSMKLIRGQNVPSARVEAVPMRDYRRVELEPYARRIRYPRGMQLDLGGIAKGWIVERAAAQLYGETDACAASAGGDIVFKGYPTETPGWQVAIEDPFDASKSLVYLQLGPGAIATSSVTKRTWNQAGLKRHHIIDPRTSTPASVDALSVTVVAPSIAAAEAYAKALLICGEAERSRLASNHLDLSYFVVWPDGKVTTLGTELYSGLALEILQ